MKRSLILGAFLAACGGTANWTPDPLPDPLPADAGATEPPVPLCPGEEEPAPTDCQTLVYDLATGYCNRWQPCGGAQ